MCLESPDIQHPKEDFPVSSFRTIWVCGLGATRTADENKIRKLVPCSDNRHYTKRIKAIPSAQTSGTPVVTIFVDQWISNFDILSITPTDNAPQFTSTFFKSHRWRALYRAVDQYAVLPSEEWAGGVIWCSNRFPTRSLSRRGTARLWQLLKGTSVRVYCPGASTYKADILLPRSKPPPACLCIGYSENENARRGQHLLAA